MKPTAGGDRPSPTWTFVRQAGKDDTCCFLAQQTAEKALKAYLFHQGEELIFTHSIFKLCDMAARHKKHVKMLDFVPLPSRT